MFGEINGEDKDFWSENGKKRLITTMKRKDNKNIMILSRQTDRQIDESCV